MSSELEQDRVCICCLCKGKGLPVSRFLRNRHIKTYGVYNDSDSETEAAKPDQVSKLITDLEFDHDHKLEVYHSDDESESDSK